MIKTCKTCKLWEKCGPNYYPSRRAMGGYCTSPKMVEGTGSFGADTLEYSYDEGGSFWTGPNFGCVHHKATNQKEKVHIVVGDMAYDD